MLGSVRSDSSIYIYPHKREIFFQEGRKVYGKEWKSFTRQARIFGSDYYDLEDKVAELLRNNKKQLVENT